MKNYTIEKLIQIHHWSDETFTIICTRNNSFKFKNGEFIMIGIYDDNHKFITRAYSIVSSNYDVNIEFLSIKVKNGLFTNIIKNLNLNDNIYICKKSVGTLLNENLLSGGKNLWLLSSGTGISPFISVFKDFKIQEKYKNIIIIHNVSYKKNLSYRYYLNYKLFNNFFNISNLIYYPIVTKDKFKENNRITYLIKNKIIFKKLEMDKFNVNNDRIMICGNINMINDLKKIIIHEYKFIESQNNIFGHFVIERAFVY